MSATSSPLPETATSRKRSLILHDSLIFLALSAVTIVLLLVTLGLFKSFEGHREELGVRWAGRGEQALRAGHPDQAVGALRTALTYRDNLQTQLQLAEALAAAGHVEEARNYFLTLRETRPGDGFINLQLARLSRRAKDPDAATDFYRASIFGNWEGDGALRRRDVRLELAAYLAQRGDTSGARDELMVAAGNTPESAATDTLFGDQLKAIGDNGDALTFYNKALGMEHPDDSATLAKAGRLAYSMGRYTDAARLLGQAAAAMRQHGHASPEAAQLEALAADAHRIPELILSRDLPATVRAEHLLTAAGIAQARLDSCLPAPAPRPKGGSKPPVPVVPAVVAPSLIILKSRWLALAGDLKQRNIARDAELQDTLAQLINDTEQGTVQPCGAPTGDNALLLTLAKASQQGH